MTPSRQYPSFPFCSLYHLTLPQIPGQRDVHEGDVFPRIPDTPLSAGGPTLDYAVVTTNVSTCRDPLWTLSIELKVTYKC